MSDFEVKITNVFYQKMYYSSRAITLFRTSRNPKITVFVQDNNLQENQNTFSCKLLSCVFLRKTTEILKITKIEFSSNKIRIKCPLVHNTLLGDSITPRINSWVLKFYNLFQ